MTRAEDLKRRLNLYGCSANELATVLRFLLDREIARERAQQAPQSDERLSGTQSQDIWESFVSDQARGV